jgi:hypothetical protein
MLTFPSARIDSMIRTDLELASDFVRRWGALPKERRGRLGKQIPVAAVQVASLSHPDMAAVRSRKATGSDVLVVAGIDKCDGPMSAVP